MPVDTKQGSVHVYDGGFLIRRNTDTVVVTLKWEEVLELIHDLSRPTSHNGISLVIESDKIYAKDME